MAPCQVEETVLSGSQQVGGNSDLYRHLLESRAPRSFLSAGADEQPSSALCWQLIHSEADGSLR